MTDVHFQLTLLGFLLSICAWRALLLGLNRPEGRPLRRPQLLLICGGQQLVPIEEAIGDGQQAGMAAVVLPEYACMIAHNVDEPHMICCTGIIHNQPRAQAWLRYGVQGRHSLVHCHTSGTYWDNHESRENVELQSYTGMCEAVGAERWMKKLW